MSLTLRHPRYMMGVAAGLLCTLLLLASQSHPTLNFMPSGVRGHSGAPGALSVKSKMEYMEEIYAQVVQERHARIRKYGPTPEDIDSFPDPKKKLPYLLWDFFPASFNCPYETERIGVMGDGGKWVCGLSRIVNKPDCVVYSAGISTESSFEASLIRRTKCQVYGFDYSVDKFGPEVENFGSIRDRAHFHKYIITGKDDHSANPPAWTLESIMKHYGHKFIDILKVDIEGAEFETLTTMMKYYKERDLPLPFGQLQLEIHSEKISFAKFLKWWEDLEEAGLRPFWTEPNILVNNWFRWIAPTYSEYSFINVKVEHDVIRD